MLQDNREDEKMAEYENPRDDRVVVTEKSSTMGWIIALVVIAALVAAAFAFGLINIDQTKTAALPDIKVETSGGQAPAFDIDTAKVDVGTKKTTVEVPTLSVDKADKTDN